MEYANSEVQDDFTLYVSEQQRVAAFGWETAQWLNHNAPRLVPKPQLINTAEFSEDASTVSEAAHEQIDLVPTQPSQSEQDRLESERRAVERRAVERRAEAAILDFKIPERRLGPRPNRRQIERRKPLSAEEVEQEFASISEALQDSDEALFGPIHSGSAETWASIHELRPGHEGASVSLESAATEEDIVVSPRLTLVSSQETIPKDFSRGLKLRTVNNTEADVNRLVELELRAFSDVYGTQVSDDKRQEIVQKYQNRIEVLGDWFKVLETVDGKEIAGMLVGCPTDKSTDELLNIDLTATHALEDIYSPNADRVYILNLATDPDAPKDLRFRLMGSMVAQGIEENKSIAIFESRLPGFDNWLTKTGQDKSQLSKDVLDQLASTYSQLTVEIDGKQEVADKLLRIYTKLGAIPLGLAPNAWDEDKPSSSYGVICKFENPLPETVRKSKTMRKLAAKALHFTANNQFIMKKLFSK